MNAAFWRMLFPCILALALPARGQTTVMGRIVDGDGGPVAYANVQLLAFADSSLVRGAVADGDGSFSLETIKPGAYRLHVSLLGYRTHLSELLTVTNDREQLVGTITLPESTVQLNELSVEARRSLYEQRGDRLVIHVASSIGLAGATALDVLERSPGVIVNKMSETISLLGKDGVRLMINGKLSYLPPGELVSYLSGISADNILSVELITSPPADLDAEGNAGYINIVMKRRPDEGLNGTVNASGGYGRGAVSNAGINVNYQGNRLSLFGSYSFVWNGQQQNVTNFRRIVGSDGTFEAPTSTLRDPLRRVHNARVGIDYQVGRKTTFGAIVGGYDNDWTMSALNRLTIVRDGSPITTVDLDNDEINRWRHGMGGLNLRQELGAGGTFTMGLDFLQYHDNNPTIYASTSTDVLSGEVAEERLESGKITPLNITVAYADFSRGLGEKWHVGAGVKGAFSRFTNDVRFESVVMGDWLTDAGLNSKSSLREDVLAAYGKLDYRPSESTSLKAGLRFEFTDSNLGTDERANIVDRRFGSFFPSFSFSHTLSRAFQINSSYSRRITRPSFNDMAPFLYFLDPFTFFTGNAALQPAIMGAYKVDLTYNSLLASFEYAREDSSIARFQSRLVPGQNVQLFTALNFRKTQGFTALLALPVQLTGWWSTQNNVMVTWTEVDGFTNEAPIVVSNTSVRLSTMQNFSLPSFFAFEVSGFYESGGLFGAWSVEPVWRVDAALQRTFSDGRGKLTLSVRDVFDSFRIKGTTGSLDEDVFARLTLDMWQRTFRLAYSTRFGRGGSTRTRTTASDEEGGRVQQ